MPDAGWRPHQDEPRRASALAEIGQIREICLRRLRCHSLDKEAIGGGTRPRIAFLPAGKSWKNSLPAGRAPTGAPFANSIGSAPNLLSVKLEGRRNQTRATPSA